MFKTLLVAVLCVCISTSLKMNPNHYTLILETTTQIISHEAETHLQPTPGFVDVPVAQSNQNIDRYIRNQVKQLQFATLIKTETQTLSDGVNYADTYKLADTLYTVLVWDKASDRQRQIRGMAKITNSTNDQGQTVKKTNISKFSSLSIEQAANKLSA